MPHRRLLPERTLWLMAGFGFASGLPLMLSGFTLAQWLTEHGVSLTGIGLTALIGLAYTLKFLWAPALDQRPPGPFARIGRRRGWLLLIQPALTAAIVALALCDPARSVTALVAVAAGVAFLSANQDIAIDAWRIETFPERLQGAAMAAYVWGYRIAMLVSGAGAIRLAGPLGWHGSLLGVAGLSAGGIVLTLLAPEPAAAPAPPRRPGLVTRIGAEVVAPLRDFLTRAGAAETLCFVLLFKLGEALAGKMAVPFYRSLGFDRAQVAAANSLPSLAASLAGAAAGGWLVAKLGTGRALILTGFAQMATMLLYIALAWSGGDVHILYAKVTLEAFAGAMADAAFITFLSALCSSAYTATQYALLSSLAALAVHTVGGTSGVLAAALGWVPFYSLTLLASLPAMLIMLHLVRRFPAAHAAGPVKVADFVPESPLGS